jgi:hypothetical protein
MLSNWQLNPYFRVWIYQTICFPIHSCCLRSRFKAGNPLRPPSLLNLNLANREQSKTWLGKRAKFLVLKVDKHLESLFFFFNLSGFQLQPQCSAA